MVGREGTILIESNEVELLEVTVISESDDTAMVCDRLGDTYWVTTDDILFYEAE